MNDFSIFKDIRGKADRKSESISNVSEIALAESGEQTQNKAQKKTKGGKTPTLNILWLYPDIMNIHGGRGDVMGLLNMSNFLGIPVEIRRVDRLEQEVDWDWAHIVYITAGELNSAPRIIEALNRKKEAINNFVEKKRVFVANGSSGAVLAKEIRYLDGKVLEGTGLLDMIWTERASVWGDDLWIKTVSLGEDSEGIEVIGNQIQVADVELLEGQKPFGTLIYGRGNNGSLANGGSGLEGARTENVIFTGVLGPVLTKNPALAADLLIEAAKREGIEIHRDSFAREGIDSANISEQISSAGEFELENKSAEFIKAFMEDKMK